MFYRQQKDILGELRQLRAIQERALECSLQVLLARFETRLLSVDTQVAIEWGNLQAAAKRKGQVLAATDALLAATAIAHGLTFVTRNTKDVRLTGVKVLDPWN